MPDAPAVPNVVAQAQELGAEVLARLDEITRQPETPSGGISIEERTRLAQEAIAKMNAIVEGFIAATKAKKEEDQQAQAAIDQAEIERLKASVS